MPSVSDKQKRTMAAAAHNPEFAKKVGIPVGVAKEFNKADMAKSRGLKDKIKQTSIKDKIKRRYKGND